LPNIFAVPTITMRLLHTRKLKLEEFGGQEIPPYAILSHTWGKNEVSFQDIEGGVIEKEGYGKVRKTCDVAAHHGFEYVWIDTCCIDKTSSAELSEAINSMYRWYQECGVCYTYLADVPSNATGPEFSKSRWFTRGWTLQELIAPSIVIFLNQNWQEIGTKSKLRLTISKITGIPDNILSGHHLERASIAQRMSWASKRETTRVEDLAYCLMGIFGVNMPMLYGEGEKAFIRLQEEIMKVSDDYSLFAWESFQGHGSLLAASPADFVHSRKIIPSNSSSALSGAITVNNKGIHMKVRFIHMYTTNFHRGPLAILPCRVDGEKEEEVAIYLEAISDSKEYFVRTHSYYLELRSPRHFKEFMCQEKSICVQQGRIAHKDQSPLLKTAAYGNHEAVQLLLENGAELEALGRLGQTPLSEAAKNGHVAVVKLLLEKGAVLEVKDMGYRTPLSEAAKNGHEAVVELLVEKGAALEATDREVRTPLSEAAKNGHEAVVKLLLEKGAVLDATNGWDQTPLSDAARNGHVAVVKLLLEKGAVLDNADLWGHTPLSEAARNGHEAVVKLLLEKGAVVEIEDGEGQTPLSWAAKNGHEMVEKLLLENGAKKS
jgi:ankyrin repeat protein